MALGIPLEILFLKPIKRVVVKAFDESLLTEKVNNALEGLPIKFALSGPQFWVNFKDVFFPGSKPIFVAKGNLCFA